MNRVYLIGNSGSKADLRYTPNQLPVLGLSLAVRKAYKKEDGSWLESTNWIRIQTFGKLAEKVSPLIDKGTPLMVEGEISVREWTSKEGEKKTSFEVIAKQIHILERKRKPEPEVFPPNTEAFPNRGQIPLEPMIPFEPMNDSDIPF